MSISPAALHIAIIGSGPAGFYAADALQKAAPGIAIDLYERLPTPFGLVRGGVAPDHPRIKSVSRVFERIASQPGFRFLGNVHVGRDIAHDDLRRHYDAVIYSVGAETDRRLNLPGESLGGVHSATELVGWYNGHPDYSESTFDFSTSTAVIIGIGNVAMDVARILTTSPDVLATTDLAMHALTALRDSRIDTVHILSRRGPAQAACTTPELRELGQIDGVDVVVDPSDLQLDPVSAERVETDRNAQHNVDTLRQWAERGATGAPRRIVFHFAAAPLAFEGDGRLTAVRWIKNRLEPDGHGDVRAVRDHQRDPLPAGLAFRSVGYHGTPVPGLPFDEARGIVPNAGGRVVESVDSATHVHGVYVTGWIKRGPHGVIGTNKACAAETVDHLLADAVAGRLPPAEAGAGALEELLSRSGIEIVSWQDWQALDAAEQHRGAAAGRPREKVVTVAEMLDIIRGTHPRR
jgi:ferredoxin/flavodoxin---NADP+ reductase